MDNGIVGAVVTGGIMMIVRVRDRRGVAMSTGTQ